jgi:hypothetical protein
MASALPAWLKSAAGIKVQGYMRFIWERPG